MFQNNYPITTSWPGTESSRWVNTFHYDQLSWDWKLSMNERFPLRPADLGLKVLDELTLSTKPSIKSARPSRTGQEARQAAPEEGLNGHHDRIAVLGKKEPSAAGSTGPLMLSARNHGPRLDQQRSGSPPFPPPSPRSTPSSPAAGAVGPRGSAAVQSGPASA